MTKPGDTGTGSGDGSTGAGGGGGGGGRGGGGGGGDGRTPPQTAGVTAVQVGPGRIAQGTTITMIPGETTRYTNPLGSCFLTKITNGVQYDPCTGFARRVEGVEFDPAPETAIGLGGLVRALGKRAGLGAAAKAGADEATSATEKAIGRELDELAEELAVATCSFDGGTLVLMADGTRKPIRFIQVGDWVLAADEASGLDPQPRRVTHVWKHRDALMHLYTSAGRITTTSDHPFYDATRGTYEGAATIGWGTELRSLDGSRIVTWGNGPESMHGWAYNLTVEDRHTYFIGVGDSGSALVHNECYPGELGEAIARGGRFYPPDEAYGILAEKYGISRGVLSTRFHAIKPKSGLGAADSTRIDRTGNVYDAQTGERLGQIIVRQG